MVPSIDEKVLRVDQFVGEEEEDTFDRPRPFVDDVTVKKVHVRGGRSAYKQLILRQ